jgi:putative oxidoreductase
MNPMTNVGLLILRVIPAAMMLVVHGWPKLSNFSQFSGQFPSVLVIGPTVSLLLAIFGEVVCPLFLIIGFGTRLAAIPAAITMFVAAFVIHLQDPFMKQEFPLLYGIMFLTLALTGGGKFSLGDRFHSQWFK